MYMKHAVAAAFLFLTLSVFAQDYWAKVPAFSNQCYSLNDKLMEQLQVYYDEVSGRITQLQEKQERKIQNMTEAERTQMAMKASTQYQNMTPDAIRKMQEEQLLQMTLMQETEAKHTAIIDKITAAQSAYRAECVTQLEPIMAEYRKLPDGEGTPDWAITKGRALMQQYNKAYEAICSKYITGANAAFKPLLEEYRLFQINTAIPNGKKRMEFQMKQFGLTPENYDVIVLEGVKAYLEKMKEVYDLRQLQKQGE
jgi:TolA-binding protein